MTEINFTNQLKDKIGEILINNNSGKDALTAISKEIPNDPDVIDTFLMRLGLALLYKFYSQIQNIIKKQGENDVEEFYLSKPTDNRH